MTFATPRGNTIARSPGLLTATCDYCGQTIRRQNRTGSTWRHYEDRRT